MERDYGFLNDDQKRIIATYRHLACRDHKYSPETCSLCDEAKKVMAAMKAGEL